MAATSAVKGGGGHMNLLALQSRMKGDPSGYEDELLLQLRHFEACLAVFQLHSSSRSLASSFANDQSGAKELADMAMFLAHVTPFYPQHLCHFPQQILGLLQSTGDSLQPVLRRHLTQALILLRNRQVMQNLRFLAFLQPPLPSQQVGSLDHVQKPVKAQAQVIYTAESMETPVHLPETMQSPIPVPNVQEQVAETPIVQAAPVQPATFQQPIAGSNGQGSNLQAMQQVFPPPLVHPGRYVRKFAKIASPLYMLTQIGVPFSWGAIEVNAFQTLKDKMTTGPVLILSDLQKSFEVYCDACGRSLGAVLMQEDRVIAYESRLFSKPEMTAQIYEKELLAKQLSKKQMRWANILSQFHFQIVHVQGQKSVVVDALSRKPLAQAISAIHHSSFEDMASMPQIQILQIIERINDVSFRLSLLDTWKIHNAFHVSLLKPFRGDVPYDGELDEQPEVEENEEILVPEQILAHKDT
ncbi:hypothetical protein L7F22_011580 [Adiantum nelumboides]|nr:hypothetical protein [Adiantum nelumboides]